MARGSFEAARTAVGNCCATSIAKLGPDSTTIAGPDPNSSAMTSDIRSSVSDSSPFVALTMVARGATKGAADRMTARHPCDGIAETISSVSKSASARASVTVTEAGNEMSGK